MKTIPYSRQWISERDVSEVVKTLRTAWLTQGPQVQTFERDLARACGAKYAVAAANGTAALHLACLALGVHPGDKVITSPNTFLASANSILYCGGSPVFADIDPDTFNIDPQQIEKRIDPKTTGILPVHFAGQPCDMEAISSLAKRHGLFVIEDAAHAIGARYRAGSRWYPVGSCSHSDACVFSFHPVKGITTGEGGAITTNRKEVYEKLLTLRTHGVTKKEDLFENQGLAFWRKNGKKQVSPWYYEMQELGFNYRITDIQSALGITQLKRLKSFIKRRREIAAIYDRDLGSLYTVLIPREREGLESAYHLYVIRLRLEKLSVGRAEIFDELRKQGLGVQVHYIPVHLQPYYRKLGWRRGDCPRAEAYYERVISIPIFPAMSSSDIKTVVKTVKQVLGKYEV